MKESWDEILPAGDISFVPQKPGKRRSLIYRIFVLYDTINEAYKTFPWVIKLESVGNWTRVTGQTQSTILSRCRECLTPTRRQILQYQINTLKIADLLTVTCLYLIKIIATSNSIIRHSYPSSTHNLFVVLIIPISLSLLCCFAFWFLFISH